MNLRMMGKLLFFTFILISATVSAQKTGGLSLFNRGQACEAYYTGDTDVTEKSFGIQPEIRGVKSLEVSLGLARGYFSTDRKYGGGGGKGFLIAGDLNLKENYVGPRIGVWGTMLLGRNLGLTGTLNAMYYSRGGNGSFLLKPEVGIGLLKLHFKYGYAFEFGNFNIPGLQRHTFSLSYYISFFKRSA